MKENKNEKVLGNAVAKALDELELESVNGGKMSDHDKFILSTAIGTVVAVVLSRYAYVQNQRANVAQSNYETKAKDAVFWERMSANTKDVLVGRLKEKGETDETLSQYIDGINLDVTDENGLPMGDKIKDYIDLSRVVKRHEGI